MLNKVDCIPQSISGNWRASIHHLNGMLALVEARGGLETFKRFTQRTLIWCEFHVRSAQLSLPVLRRRYVDANPSSFPPDFRRTVHALHEKTLSCMPRLVDTETGSILKEVHLVTLAQKLPWDRIVDKDVVSDILDETEQGLLVELVSLKDDKKHPPDPIYVAVTQATEMYLWGALGEMLGKTYAMNGLFGVRLKESLSQKPLEAWEGKTSAQVLLWVLFVGWVVSTGTSEHITTWFEEWLFATLMKLGITDEDLLRIIDLGDEGMHPPYTCLSYTWGSPFPPSTPLSSQYGADTGTKGPYLTISVDGEEIAVTRSLCEALHQLRQSVPGKLQPIWIDAICIDQRHPEGNVERGKQVAMMDRIYSTAEHVLVWLGPTNHHAASAIPALRRLASVTIHALQATVDVEEPLSTSDPELYEKLEIPFITRNQWKQVRGFYERTWFQRTWVTQEAALARSISFHMGSHTLSWDQIEKAASVIYRVTGLFPDRFNRSPGIVQICLNPNEDTDATELTSLAWNSIRSIDMLRKEQKEYGSTRSYHQRIQLGDEAMVVATREYHDNPAAWREFRTHVLHKNREKKSSDPRDKIYGILGLLRGMVDEQGKKL
ncbi:hypothetical protein SLS56_012118 [Neofusicoccum ribis]|uniref:Heterokaryon incompatibility domain-containing protein n=1 Tax=Neofusicoccum ribis TaxID=45134 RepID=A0ABR3S9Q8_9PEZI